MNTVPTQTPSDEADPAGRPRRWTRWIILVVIVAAAGVAAIWRLTASGDEEDTAQATATVDFEEVAVADLTQVETLNGTLGFDEGDPVTTRAAGTITGAAEAGDIVTEGDILYTVDDDPVTLLFGDEAAWRAMGLVPDTEQLTYPGGGTITWLAEEGTTLEQGDVLMTIDERPIVLLYGDVPSYRTLRNGDEGADVEQLEAALTELGYNPGDVTVNEEFTSNTGDMVADWQEEVGADDDERVDLGEVLFIPGPLTIDEWSVSVGDQAGGAPIATTHVTATATEGSDVLALEEALLRLGINPDGSLVADGVFDEHTEAAVLAWQRLVGAEDDGIVDPEEIVFLPEGVRISDRLVDPGGSVAPGAPVLATSTDESVVTVDLPAGDQDLLEEGDRVEVELPTDERVGGTVASKASTATLDGASGQATFDVVIVLDDPSVSIGFDQAPVDVDVVTDSVFDVMAVPVTALLVLAEGGYAVEVDAGDGTTRLVAVDPGMYADGLVEVTSNGIRPGDRVVAP